MKTTMLLGSLFLVACSGTTFQSIPDPGNDPKPAMPTAEAGADSAASAEASVDAGTQTSIAKHCVGPLTDPDICIENVQGRAGETVDVDVYFLGSLAIDSAEEMGGAFFVDPAKFSVDNPADVMGCRTRRLSLGINPADTVIQWSAFGNNVVGGCPNMLAAGKVDTIKLHIVPGTPPGDYKLIWDHADMVTQGNLYGKGMPGVLRVLP